MSRKTARERAPKKGYHRRGNRFCVHMMMADGRRRWISCADEESARRIRNAWAAENDRLRQVTAGVDAEAVPAGEEKFSDVLPAFEATISAKSPYYVSKEMSVARAFADFCEARRLVRPKAVRAVVLDDWARERAGACSPATVRSQVRALSVFYSFLKDRGLIVDDHSKAKAFRKLVSDLTRQHDPKNLIGKKLLTQGEVDLMFSKLRRPWSAIAALGIDCGLRSAELRFLTAGDLDFIAGRVYVRAKTIEGKEFTPKARRPRSVGLTAKTVELLRVEAAGKRPGDLLFPNAEGKLRERSRFSKDLAEALRDVGVNHCGHDLRHSFVSRALSAGVPLHVVQAAAGHANLEVTAQYAHALDEQIGEAAEALSAYRGPVTKAERAAAKSRKPRIVRGRNIEGQGA